MSAFVEVEVGSVAPELSLHHHPRLLAFVRAWSLDHEPPVDLALVRQRLADLDAELVIVCEDGAWSFVRDHEPVFCDRLAGDIATVSAVYGVRGDAVFVIDQRGVVRFAHQPDQPLSATITEALDAAGHALDWRQYLTRLERVQWSAREWALKCLVVGCALTFLAGCPRAGAAVDPAAGTARPQIRTAVERHPRFARGTGQVTRVAITPRTDASAPVAQLQPQTERS